MTNPLEGLNEEQAAELDAILEAEAARLWRPLPGPQSMAFESEADIVGFGGAAGGGKTDLAIGLSFEHQRIGVFRQNGTEITAIIDRYEELFGNRDGYNGSDRIWRTTKPDGSPMQVEFGSFPSPNEERKYRGRPHDLLVFDEAAEMRETAVRFLLGWLRTTDPSQRCRALFCFNPPTTVEGRWIMGFFAPWLDRKHPNPAKPGELRWFATVDGHEREFMTGESRELDGELVTPTSRTFIPSRITDNPHLMGTGYMAQLMSMPEPLRSQLLYGDFQAGVEDDPYQVIPTAWVEAAMARWKKPEKMKPMDSIGVDVAMRGRDKTVIARRHGTWFDEPIEYEGSACKDGPTTAGFIMTAVRDRAPIHIDLFGVGAEPYGHLMAIGAQVMGCSVGEPARGVAKDGRLQFRNWRSELWWRMRESLAPVAAEKSGIALPPHKGLLADLCTPKWKLAGNVIQVQSRDEIVKELGRSPDYASAYCLAMIDTPKRHIAAAVMAGLRDPLSQEPRGHDPYKDL